MHTGGFWSLVVNQCYWGQAQGGLTWLPPPSLGAVGLGTWGDVAGDRCPTRAAHGSQHGNRRCPRTAHPATCCTFPALFPGLPTPPSHRRDVNTALSCWSSPTPPALWQLRLLMERSRATCSLLGCWGGTGMIRQPGVGKNPSQTHGLKTFRC